MGVIKDKFREKSEAMSLEMKDILKQHGDKKIGEVFLSQVYLPYNIRDSKSRKDNFRVSEARTASATETQATISAESKIRGVDSTFETIPRPTTK